MAKKQSGAPADEKAAAPAPEQAAEPAEPKKGKTKEPKTKEAKAKPDAPGGAAPTAPGQEPTAAKKKGFQPGKPPSRGKKLLSQLKNNRQKVAKEGPVPLKRGLQLLKSLKRAKFDETVEVHMSLGIDPTQSDQMIRGSVPLPHGLGKVKRVVVFCQGDNVPKAKEAGADDLIERIQKQNWLEFDVALATQDMMGKVSRLGKVLGPRGLMPTPKAGTVITGDVAQAVLEFKAGKVEYRTDKGGNVHAGVGKLSFDDDKLVENIQTFVDAIRGAKPSGIKGNYVKSITVASTMGPGVPVVM